MTNKYEHLQMIQGIIDRMSTTSAIFKGFCATIMAGISAISFTEINKWIFLASLLLVFSFFLLDAYYFILEKKYRILYEQIRTDKKEADYNLKLELTKTDCINGNATFVDCIKSPCIYLFYLPIVLICSIIILLKIKGVA